MRARPFIHAQPLSITNANINQTVTFTNTPVGTPPFQFQWQLNGVNLGGETNATLTITNAQLVQGGTYTCVAVNELGFINTDPATLEFALLQWPPSLGAGQPAG